jgi:heterodisulfide reductase subunit C
LKEQKAASEIVQWYDEARDKSCCWWLENHVIAKHSFTSCMSCGACTALCPAAEFYEFSPREIMTIVQEKDEQTIIELLKSEKLWYCHQCGSCKTKCPRENSPFGMISSLRQLSQLKGHHIDSIRGRQQYYARHLWGGNLWNRACTLYFRNPVPDTHQDFGPRFKTYFSKQDEFMKRVGAQPDMEGGLSGRKIPDATLDELRCLWLAGGAVFLWALIDEAAQKQSEEMHLFIDDYFFKVKTEG